MVSNLMIRIRYGLADYVIAISKNLQMVEEAWLVTG